MPRLKHLGEYAALKGFEVIFRTLPLNAASTLGGAILGFIGPRLPQHKRANRQLRAIFPDWVEEKYKAVLKGMWNNLGRTIAEFLSLPNDELLKNVTLHGRENLAQPGQAAIYITGHMGNWELLPAIPRSANAPIVVMHRAAANPLSEAIIEKKRMTFAHSLANKSAHGIAQLMRALKDNRGIGMLTDFRISGSVEAPFFGISAMTSPLPAELAVKYGAIIIPSRIVRREGAFLDAYIYPRLKWDSSGNAAEDVKALTLRINAIYEEWIREKPEQWLWFHERFGKGRF